MHLHRDAVVADAHNDLLMLVARRPKEVWSAYFRERWIPQLRDGGIDVQVLPVFIDSEFLPEGALRETLRMIEAAHRIAEANADEVALCTAPGEIVAATAAGKIALVLALEGCPQIDTDLELLQTLQRLGVRMVSFTHFGRSALGDGSGEDATGSRLTHAGVEAVQLLEELGVLIDVSHVGRASTEHILDVAGEDHVGLGSDFVAEVFGEKIPACDRPVVIQGLDAELYVPGLEGPAGMPLVTDALLARGLPEATIRKVLGQNLVRVLSS